MFDHLDPETEKRLNSKLAEIRKNSGFKKLSDAIKSAEQNKKAVIDKRVKSNFEDNLSDLVDKEPDLPEDLLDEMSEDLPDSLSTTGSMMIVIKPREFQRMYLKNSGLPDLADDLDERGLCFRTGAKPDKHFGVGNRIIPKIMEMLLPLLKSRSAAGPAINKRIIMIRSVGGDNKERAELDHPLMDKVSSAYSSYRRDLIYNLPDLVKTALDDEKFRNFWHDPDKFGSVGVVKHGSNVMESLISMNPVSYVNHAHFERPISSHIDENCSLGGLLEIG